MWATYICLLLFIVMGNAQQRVISDSERIFENSAAGANLLAAAVVGSPSQCARTIAVLTDSPTSCLNSISPTGTVISSSGCPAALVGATELACLAGVCYALNPTTRQVIVLSSDLLSVVATFGDGNLTAPTLFTALQRTTSGVQYADILVVDAGNTVWQFSVRYPTISAGPITSRQVPVPALAGTPVGIFMNTINSFMIAFSGDTSISVYNLTGTLFGTFGTFGGVQFFSVDSTSKVYVSDSGCACVKILNAAGTWISTIEQANPLFVTQSLTNVLVGDSQGLLLYSDPVVNFTLSVSDITCDAQGGSIVINNTVGGVFPLKYVLLPDYVIVTQNSPSATVTYSKLAHPTFRYPWAIFAENWTLGVTVGGTTTNRTIIPNSEFPSHSGDSSFGIQFGPPAGIFGPTPQSVSLTCGNFGCLDAKQFGTLSFWINPGLGGQNFSLSITSGPIYYFTAGSPSLPLNTWTQVVIDLPLQLIQKGTSSAFGGFTFNDLRQTANQNFWYLDDFELIPYDIPSRAVRVFDPCFDSSTFEIEVQNRAFKINLDTTPVSCSAVSSNSPELTTNGDIIVSTVHGEPPFTYSWTFTNSTNGTLVGYPEWTTAPVIFGNSLNTSWADFSVAPLYSLADSTHYRSSPYSFSLQPTALGQFISFITQRPISIAQFPVIEFWIYGGEQAAQGIYLNLYLGNDAVKINNAITNLIGNYYAIPPNVWMKATLTFTGSDLSKSYNTIAFQSYGDRAQPRIWIDDLVLLGTDIVRVNDSTGCMATTRRLVIPAPAPLVQTASVTNTKCYNISDGSIALSVSGGVAPYTYSWSVSQSTRDESSPTQIGLGESTVTATVTDANGCQISPVFQTSIIQPPPLNLHVAVKPVMCNAGKGQLDAFVVGGTGPYTYTWASAAGTPPILPQPEPQPIFTDALAPLFTTSSNVNRTCLGTGSHVGSAASPSHSGYCSLAPLFSTGTPNASIFGCSACLQTSTYDGIKFWIYADSSSSFTSLQVVLMRDDVAVSPTFSLSDLSSNLTAGQWNEIYISLSVSSVENPDQITFTSSTPDTMGTIYLDDIVAIPKINGSVGIATYAGFHSIVVVESSLYFLTVVDSNGCYFSQQIQVNEPEPLVILAEIDDPSSTSATDGSIHVSVTGGTPPYSYLWLDTNETTQSISDIAYGPHSVQITDANGCSNTTTFFVTHEDGVRRLRAYNSGLSGGLAALIGVGFLVLVFAFIMLGMYWDQFSKLGSFLCFMVLLGVLTSYAAAAVILPKPTDALCTLFPWLLGVAFILVYGCLFIKTWALYEVWSNAVNFKRRILTPAYILKCLGLAMFVEIVFLIIWTVVDPPHVRRVKSVDNTLERQCESDTPTFWIIFLSAKGAWMIFGAVLSVLTRNIVKEYNESSSIAYAIYNNVLLSAIAVPLAVLLKEVPGGRLVVMVVVVVMAFTFTMVVMFFRVWHRVFLPEKMTNMPNVHSGVSRTTASNGSSKSSGSPKGSANTGNTATESSGI